MIVHVVKAAISDLTVTAIVNPTNSFGIMDHGLARQLREQGGQEIEDEARALAPIAVGAAVVTGGHRLWAKQVIHTPMLEEPASRGPVKIGVENVRRAARAALLAASRLQLDVLAIPAIGIGPRGVEPNEAARAILDEIRAHKQPFPQVIYLADLKDEMIWAFEEALRASNG